MSRTSALLLLLVLAALALAVAAADSHAPATSESTKEEPAPPTPEDEKPAAGSGKGAVAADPSSDDVASSTPPPPPPPPPLDDSPIPTPHSVKQKKRKKKKSKKKKKQKKQRKEAAPKAPTPVEPSEPAEPFDWASLLFFMAPLDIFYSLIGEETLASAGVGLENLFVFRLTALLTVVVVGVPLLKQVFRTVTAPPRNAILLAGNSGSGKTALFFLLRDGEFRQTHTSMMQNDGTFVPQGVGSEGDSKPYRFLDFPGHLSQRPMIEGFLPQAKALLFTVDSLEDAADSGEFLHELLSSRVLVSNRVPILVAVSKTDELGGADADAVRSALARKIDSLLDVAHTVEHLDEASATANKAPIQRAGDTFDFDADYPGRVEFTTFSAKSGDLTGLADFFQSI